MAKGTVVGNHALIIKMYHQGTSLSGIARLAGVATTQIAQVLERAGLRERAKMRGRDPVEEKKIAADYAAGDSLETLMDRYECGDWKIRACVKRHGGQLRRRGQQTPRFTEAELASIFSKAEAGISQFDIGRMLGIGQTTVSRILASHGRPAQGGRPRRERHGHWKGGRSHNQDGYTLILVASDDPMASMRNSAGYVFEHRLIMARKLGRPLTASETVHHIDNDRTNNHPDNLQLRQGRHGKHACHVCLDCGSRNIGTAPL